MNRAGKRRRILCGIAAAAMMASAPAGQAQETHPATAAAPSSLPSTQALDQSTPKRTLKKLSRAMDAGDQAAIHQVLDYHGALQGQMADSIARMAAAQAQLKQAALRTYGKEGARGLLGDSISEVGDQMLASAREQIDGDTATVSIQGGDSIVLKRIDGQWKLPLSEVSKGVSEEEIRQRIDEIAHQAAIYQETAAEVMNKKYKTSEQVAEALRGRLLKAATQPTSRPNESEPATRP